jgi:phosphopantetheinyl transferase (holo-ACP synthase)
MIGNDIVDLQLAKLQSNWQRPRFIEKIFTKEEQDFIKIAQNPALEIWKLWSRKEAAYKIYNRETGIRGYFPWKLECSISVTPSNIADDFVKINSQKYFTKTYFDYNSVYTVAVKRAVLFTRISEIATDTKVIKINGLPCFEESLKPISITHHGRFERRITLLDF